MASTELVPEKLEEVLNWARLWRLTGGPDNSRRFAIVHQPVEKTPKEVVDRLSSEVAKAVRNPAFAAKLEGLGIEPVGNTPEQAADFLRAEVAKWGAIIRDASGRPIAVAAPTEPVAQP